MENLVTGTQGVPALSQGERVIDTFIAPSKTFTDLRRSASWWLPFVLALVVTMLSAFAVDRTVGFEHVAEHEMQKNPKAAERVDSLSPEQRARSLQLSGKITRVTTYGAAVFMLGFAALWSLLLWASFNFGFGAQTTYAQMFALVMYASLPRLLTGLLNVVLLFAGVNSENYDIRNPVGTNLGYYMQDSPNWMKTALSFFDIIGIWSLVLTIIGGAILARVSRGKAAAVVVGWWAFALVVMTAVAAAFS